MAQISDGPAPRWTTSKMAHLQDLVQLQDGLAPRSCPGGTQFQFQVLGQLINWPLLQDGPPPRWPTSKILPTSKMARLQDSPPPVPKILRSSKKARLQDSPAPRSCQGGKQFQFQVLGQLINWSPPISGFFKLNSSQKNSRSQPKPSQLKSTQVSRTQLELTETNSRC